MHPAAGHLSPPPYRLGRRQLRPADAMVMATAAPRLACLKLAGKLLSVERQGPVEESGATSRADEARVDPDRPWIMNREARVADHPWL